MHAIPITITEKKRNETKLVQRFYILMEANMYPLEEDVIN